MLKRRTDGEEIAAPLPARLPAAMTPREYRERGCRSVRPFTQGLVRLMVW